MRARSDYEGFSNFCIKAGIATDEERDTTKKSISEEHTEKDPESNDKCQVCGL